MIKVIVLAGGTSDERDVSLRSGAAVTKALAQAENEFQVTMLDPAGGLDSLLPQLKKADVIFPALHGTGGEDGTLQNFLEGHKIKYVGSDRRASALCFDKAGYTALLAKQNILVPKTELVTAGQFEQSPLIKQPFVLKPNDGGSSIDTSIVRDPAVFDSDSARQAFERHTTMLLQELIEGVEITAAILVDQALPIIEIIPPSGGEFDYANKYNGQTQELCPPKHVSRESQEKARNLAMQIHDLTGCHDLSRTDMIVTTDGKLYILETNTIPGLTEESLVPKAASEAGYSMPELCRRLVEAALYANT
jgi:D-alanine-D-alanine ligase